MSPNRIINTIIAFANTAGGTIIIGVKDKAKEAIGVKDVLKEEEKIANMVADSIMPPCHITLKVKVLNKEYMSD